MQHLLLFSPLVSLLPSALHHKLSPFLNLHSLAILLPLTLLLLNHHPMDSFPSSRYSTDGDLA